MAVVLAAADDLSHFWQQNIGNNYTGISALCGAIDCKHVCCLNQYFRRQVQNQKILVWTIYTTSVSDNINFMILVIDVHRLLLHWYHWSLIPSGTGYSRRTSMSQMLRKKRFPLSKGCQTATILPMSSMWTAGIIFVIVEYSHFYFLFLDVGFWRFTWDYWIQIPTNH